MIVSRETWLAFAGVTLATASAHADPQWNTAVVPAVAWVRSGGQSSRPFYLGGQADVMFGRTSNASWGVGPMARIGSYRFSDLQLQLGASVLLPVHDYLPLVLSGGLYSQRDGDLRTGGFASLYWGTRSFNYHGSYVMTGGLVLEARQTAGDGGEKTVLVGANIDLQAVLLPAVMLINAFR